VETPYFRYAKGSVDGKPIERIATDVGLQDEVGRWVNIEIDSALAPNRIGVFKVETGVWFKSSVKIVSFERC